MIQPPPEEAATTPNFEKDAQEFFKHFDKTQDETDSDLVQRLRGGLDGLLIYAGLFAGVNSAFLLYTLPNLKPNPADDTNALLQQLIQSTKFPDQSSPIYLPSSTFVPKRQDILVNRLYTVSLCLSLIVSLIVVWGKQWLVNYQSKGTAGVEQHRWARFNRFRAAKHWGLVQTLELALPLLFISTLFIFGWGLTIQFIYSGPWAEFIPLWVVIAATVLAVGILPFASILDPYCPYHTPLSEILLIGLKIVFLSLFGLFFLIMAGLPRPREKSIWQSLGNWISHPQLQRLGLGGYVLRSHEQNRGRTQEATDDRERDANQTYVEVLTTNPADEMTDSTDAIMPQAQFSYIIRSIAEWLVESQIQRQHKRPGHPQTLRKHAIVHVFKVSGDPSALYYAAASVCCVEEQKSLHFIYSNEECRERLLLLFLDAVPPAHGDHEQKALEAIPERQRDIVVLGTAIFHLAFSLGSSARLNDLLDTGRKRASSTTAEKDGLRQVVHGLTCLWYVQDHRLGQQRSVFTSTSLAAGLLLGCLGFNTPIFYEESRSLAYLLDSISSAEPDSWNQLALLALVCNTRGGRAMHDRIDAGFRRIQMAYIARKPSGELADAVSHAIRSHIHEQTRLPCEVFKLAWKLSVHGGREMETEACRMLGTCIPFLGILEEKVRDEDMPSSYREYFRGLRSECLGVMSGTTLDILHAERMENSASWLFRAKCVFKTIDQYATCVMALGDARHWTNREALSFIRRIKALLPAGPPKDPSCADRGRVETDYKSQVKTFEETCERFESYIRSGQIERRVAPEDRWCFS